MGWYWGKDSTGQMTWMEDNSSDQRSDENAVTGDDTSGFSKSQAKYFAGNQGPSAYWEGQGKGEMGKTYGGQYRTGQGSMLDYLSAVASGKKSAAETAGRTAQAQGNSAIQAQSGLAQRGAYDPTAVRQAQQATGQLAGSTNAGIATGRAYEQSQARQAYASAAAQARGQDVENYLAAQQAAYGKYSTGYQQGQQTSNRNLVQGDINNNWLLSRYGEGTSNMNNTLNTINGTGAQATQYTNYLSSLAPNDSDSGGGGAAHSTGHGIASSDEYGEGGW
jgi:hypothetical protein